MLEVKNLTKRFSGITAVDNVSMSVKKGETLGIIGTNGAGKTTLFNILSGFETADSGTVLYEGRDVTRLSQNSLVRLGFARTFQNLRLFYDMTVRENLLVSAFARKTDPKACDDLLKLSNLWEKRNHLSSALAYGEMRKLELLRATATGARILFLDEPSAAMTRPEATELDLLIKTLKATYSLTVLLIEHNMELVSLSCDRVCAMDRGRIISSGAPNKVLSDPVVTASMLPRRKYAKA